MSQSIRFFLPGPTWVREDVLAQMAKPVIGHRSAAFKELYAGIAAKLQPVLRTRGDVLLATSSATLVTEAAVESTVAEDVLNLVCGAFSERWHTVSRSLGKRADRLEVPWGQAIDPDLLRAALRRKRYEAVTLVHNETSTGVMNPLEELARVIREESDALVLVDAVSSLAGAPIEVDAWGLDIVLASIQKAFAAPPGLTVFSLSERAARKAAEVPHRGYYTDLLRYRDKHRAGGTITTPAVSICYALDRQLDHILAEGVEARWQRHQALQQQTAVWADAAGCSFAAAPGARSRTISCLRPPAGLGAPELVARLAGQGFVVGGGYGDWKPTTFRIGHMGEVRPADLEALLDAIDAIAVAV